MGKGGGGLLAKVMTTTNIVGASMNHRSCFEEKKPQNSEESSI